MSAASWFLIGFLSLLWGGSFFFTEILLPHVGPVTLAAGRVGVAAFGLWAYVAATGRAMPGDLRLWGTFVIGGFFNFTVPFICYSVAQVQITSGLAAILNALTPIAVVIVSQLWLGGEKATWLKSAGVAMGLLGVAVLIAPAAETGFGGPLGAILIGLLGPFGYGVALNYARRFAVLDPTVTVTGTLTGASLVTVPAALALEGVPHGLPLDAIGAFAALGLVCTAFAFRFMYVLLPRVGATNFSVVTLLVPPSAIALGTLFLGERLQAADFAGMLVIFAGLALVDGRLPRAIGARLAGSQG